MELLEIQVLRVHRAAQGQEAHLALLGALEHKGKKEILDLLDPREQLDHQDLQVLQGQKETMEPLDLLGREDHLDLLEILVLMGLKVHRAVKVKQVPVGHLEQLVSLEPEVTQDHKALLD